MASALRQILDDVPAVAGFLRSKATGRGPIAALELSTFVEQPPLPTNRVVLSDERDDLGLRRARVHWAVSELERRSVRELHTVIATEMRGCGLGALDSPFLALDPDGPGWPRFRDASHHSGTTRMGLDPATSVVDQHGQVHDVENLLVAGSSVFPTVGYANPTFTIVALSLRLADEVARRLSHPAPIVSPAPTVSPTPTVSPAPTVSPLRPPDGPRPARRPPRPAIWPQETASLRGLLGPEAG